MRKIFILVIVTMLSACATAKPVQGHADLVVVEKRKHMLSLYQSGRELASYHVVFGRNPVGPKEVQGDDKTPEGAYTVDSKHLKTGYHKAFHVSYPGAQDIARAKKLGVDPGGAIMVHGQKNGYGWASFVTQRFNWTHGCIALSDDDLDAMWDAVDVGTRIEIRP